MSEENKLYFKAEKEAIFLLLTGESLNIHDVKTNLSWNLGSLILGDGESMESINPVLQLMNYSIKMKLMITVPERIAKSANPLALLTAYQPYSDNYLSMHKTSKTNTTSSPANLVHLTDTEGKEIQNQLHLNPSPVSEEE
ncbi:hypothetical protein Tco_1371453 [Tanacetum coccineum]